MKQTGSGLLGGWLYILKSHQISRLGRGKQRGFTIVELAVVVLVCALLAALFGASLSRASSFARAAACKTNLRQQGLAVSMYLNDFHRYPLAYDFRVADAGAADVVGGGASGGERGWVRLLRPYVQVIRKTSGDSKAFLCPELEPVSGGELRAVLALSSGESVKPVKAYGTYGYNAYGSGVNRSGSNLGLGRDWDPVDNSLIEEVLDSRVVAPADMIAIADSSGFASLVSPVVPRWMPRSGSHWLPSRRHTGSANVVFCEGHVERISLSRLIEPSAEARRRWNNDNEPHPETW
jgi:prepilin-type N-terminal cleavage/methylation domain-containing protein/prepilin-type processing-associated H-X9-DG protein